MAFLELIQRRCIVDGGGLCRTQVLEANDLGAVAAAFDVCLRRTVTSLASMLIALQQRRVRRAGRMLIPNLFVTGFADVGFGVLAGYLAWKRSRCLRRRT